MASHPGSRRECLEFELWLHARSCEEVHEHEWGRAFLTPGLSLAWDASWLAVERPGLTFAEVVEHADLVFGGAGLAHRLVAVCDEDEGARVCAEAEAEPLPGWGVERAVYMELRREREREARAPVAQVGLEEIAGLRQQLIREALPKQPAETAEQLVEMERRHGAVAGDRWFVAPGPDPAATCQLLRGNGVGQVESVGTAVRARGRGLAQSVVLAAAAASRAAGDRLTFLTAEAEDWPRLLYAKLGFEPIGELHLLRRPAP